MRAAWLVVCFVIACSSPDEESRPNPGIPVCDPTLVAPASVPELAVLGETSNGEYVPLEPDQVLVRHTGPQGGQHFWLRVRVFASEELTWSVEAELTSAGGATLAEGFRSIPSCADAWTKEREITVFLASFGNPVNGTLTVTADSLAITQPVSVP